MQNVIPTRVINLKHRIDRREHIQNEFAGRNEFSMRIIAACEHVNGAMGLWQSICRIVDDAGREGLPYVLICEDDHQFTDAFSPGYLLECIAAAEAEGGDVLLGAVSWFDCALPVCGKLHWVGKFTGTQFMIIYRKFYNKIISADFGIGDNADHKIASLTRAKYFMSRPVSTQVYFGYSDITARNELEGRLEELFDRSKSGIDMLDIVSRYYQKEIDPGFEEEANQDFSQICLPVFVVMPAGHNREGIQRTFFGKPEFDVMIIEKGDDGGNSHLDIWEGIREAIEIGKGSGEDVIIICSKDHSFTGDYSKEYLLRHIVAAHQQGADLLLGGCKTFHRAFPVGESRYWIASGTAAPFLVVFSKFFDKLLDEPFDEHVDPADLINEITFHKMLMYPFISSPVEDLQIIETTQQTLAEMESASRRYFWPGRRDSSLL